VSKYPDIPVIVNSEMGIHFDGNENVIVDPELSHDEIAAAGRRPTKWKPREGTTIRV